jgi:hypothetical protein
MKLWRAFCSELDNQMFNLDVMDRIQTLVTIRSSKIINALIHL